MPVVLWTAINVLIFFYPVAEQVISTLKYDFRTISYQCKYFQIVLKSHIRMLFELCCLERGLCKTNISDLI